LGFSGAGAAGISACYLPPLLRSPSAPASSGGAGIACLLADGDSLSLGVTGVLHNATCDGAAGAVVARGLQAQLGLLVVGEDGLGLRLAENIAGVHYCLAVI
jgi:hypothetical protein